MDHATTGASEDRPCVCQGDCRDDIGQLKAKDVMRYGVISIDRKASITKAVSLLLKKGISGLAVTDQGGLCGMLSQKDLLKLIDGTQYLPGLVEDYMTRDVTSFDVEDRLALVCEGLIESHFRRAPVLYQQKLAGMISRGDLICAYKEAFRPAQDGSASVACNGALAEDVMRHGLLAVHPRSPLYDAMDMIARYRVTGLPVVDAVMYLVGIVTEKDLLHCVTRPTPAGTTVESIMTREVIAFDRKATLDEICACLIEKDIHRVPILDQGRLVGTVSRSDILRRRSAVLKLGTARCEDGRPRRAARGRDRRMAAQQSAMEGPGGYRCRADHSPSRTEPGP
ncbi:MAG TPA: CBS domain-containing protein, partial [Candidatus Paceibacterota bacterium]|nr:CBS domain-containing protein [Candidatus Paceibacterota bacterium]